MAESADHARTLSLLSPMVPSPTPLGEAMCLRESYDVRCGTASTSWARRRLCVQDRARDFCGVGDAFPELRRAQSTIMAVLEGEERDFNRTIDKGARFFQKRRSS